MPDFLVDQTCLMFFLPGRVVKWHVQSQQTKCPKIPNKSIKRYQKHFHGLRSPSAFCATKQVIRSRKCLGDHANSKNCKPSSIIKPHWTVVEDLNLIDTSMIPALPACPYTLLPFQFRTLSCAATTTTSSTSSQQHKQARIHRNASQDLHQPPNNNLSTFLNKCIQRSPAVCPEHPKQIALQMAS